MEGDSTDFIHDGICQKMWHCILDKFVVKQQIPECYLLQELNML